MLHLTASARIARIDRAGTTKLSCQRPAARGLSLLEIIVALGVLGGSAVVLAQLVDLGARHAERAIEITACQTAAQNVMQEIMVGQRPLVSISVPEPVDAWSDWDVSILITPLGIGELQAVTVTVYPSSRDATSDADADTQGDAAPQPLASTSGRSSATGSSPFVANASTNVAAPAAFHLTRWFTRSTSDTHDTQRSDF